jgi:hypothetical protein
MTTNNRTRDSNERFYAPAPIGLFKRLAIAGAVLGSMLMFRSVSDGASGPTLNRRGGDQDRRRRKG